MGKIKNSQKNGKTHILSEREMNYLRILNSALSFNTYKDKIISGFCYYVCTNKFGYAEDENLIFEIDLDNEKNELKVRTVPPEVLQEVLDTTKNA